MITVTFRSILVVIAAAALALMAPVAIVIARSIARPPSVSIQNPRTILQVETAIYDEWTRWAGRYRLYTRRQAAFASLRGRRVMVPEFRYSSFGEAALSTFAKDARSFAFNAGMMLQSEPRLPYFRARILSDDAEFVLVPEAIADGLVLDSELSRISLVRATDR